MHLVCTRLDQHPRIDRVKNSKDLCSTDEVFTTNRFGKGWVSAISCVKIVGNSNPTVILTTLVNINESQDKTKGHNPEKKTDVDKDGDGGQREIKKGWWREPECTMYIFVIAKLRT